MLRKVDGVISGRSYAKWGKSGGKLGAKSISGTQSGTEKCQLMRDNVIAMRYATC